MKKITYIAAAALSLVACTKAELAPEQVVETSGKHNIEVAVTVGEDTKASFDGSNFIQFASGDRFYGFIAKKDDPRKGIYHSDYANPGEDDYDYYSSFTIADYKAEHPVFKGHLYCIEEKDFADEYCFYGLFPYTASYYGSDITKWPITLKQEQNKASQTSWDGSADVMIMQPSTISTEGATQDKLGDYSCIYSGTVANFAHLFGFAKISFAGIPAKYADQVVKSVQIQAVGDNKDLTGRYYVDLTTGDPNQELVNYSPSDYAKITPTEKVKISDYKAWFVFKPGTYDVKITVSTAAADFEFERKGLVIERSKIAEPTVNYKSTDVTTSHDITLAEGETWETVLSYNTCLSSSKKEVEWGPTGKKLVFSLDYPGSTNSNYGNYLSSDGYVQLLAYQNIIGGKVVLSSATQVKGASIIKTNFGIYSKDVTADFTLSLVDGDNTYILGKVTVTGSNENTRGKDYYFENKDNKSGRIVITVDNFSDTNCRPYLRTLVINPDAEIVFEAETIKLEKAASAGEFVCGVYAAKGEPTVTVSSDAASWLTGVSYKDGRISYNVSENTGAKRTATITVTAKGITEVSKSVTLVQASATAVEYKLAFTAKDFLPFVEAKKAELDAAGTTYGEYDSFPVSGTVKAIAVDGSGKSVNVGFTASKVYLTKCTEAKLRAKSDISFTDEFGEIKSIVVSSDYKAAVSGWGTYPVINLSKDGSSYAKFAPTSVTGSGTDDAPYQNVLNSGIDEYSWFKVTSDNALYYYGFEVTFVAD